MLDLKLLNKVNEVETQTGQSLPSLLSKVPLGNVSTITVKQIMIIQKLLASILEQCNERTVFEIVDNVLERDEWREAHNSDSKEIMIDIK